MDRENNNGQETECCWLSYRLLWPFNQRTIDNFWTLLKSNTLRCFVWNQVGSTTMHNITYILYQLKYIYFLKTFFV